MSTQDVEANAEAFYKLAEAYSKVPEGTRLPSGVVYHRNTPIRNWKRADAKKDDKWVLETYGTSPPSDTVARDAPSRSTAEASTQPVVAVVEPPPATIPRDDPRRSTPEETRELDEVLAGLPGPASELAPALPGFNELRVLMKDQEQRKQGGIKKRKNDPTRTIGAYTPQYYSGAQAQIYFEDVLIDEIQQFQFSTVTNKTPIYGYASELFDTVARGNLLVHGSFVINFVEAGYLPIIAMAIQERKYGSEAIGRMSTRPWVPGIKRSAPDARPQSIPNQTVLRPGSFLANQAINQVRGLGNKEFRELSRELNINKIQRDSTFSGTPSGYISRFDLLPPFDIFAIFGDITDPNADHTVRRIKNVYLTGQSQTIIHSGEPIAEQYSFIARTIE